MIKIKLMTLLLLIGLLAALPALAAHENNPSSSQPGGSMESEKTTNQQGSMEFHAFNAKDLIGKEVKDQGGETLGRVEDLAVGKDGFTDYVVLEHDRKYFPIPYQAFMSNATNFDRINTERHVATNFTKSKIDEAPSFSSREWDMSSKDWQDKVCSYYGSGQCPHRFM
jgi:hypothetical protein